VQLLHTVGLPCATVHCPVVVAVLMYAALAIIEQTVSALLQAHSTVRALEEVVTQVRVWVRLDAMLLRAGWHVQ
jgi:hypothetical protein